MKKLLVLAKANTSFNEKSQFISLEIFRQFVISSLPQLCFPILATQNTCSHSYSKPLDLLALKKFLTILAGALRSIVKQVNLYRLS